MMQYVLTISKHDPAHPLQPEQMRIEAGFTTGPALIGGMEGLLGLLKTMGGPEAVKEFMVRNEVARGGILTVKERNA